jgi:hypothetical protein
LSSGFIIRLAGKLAKCQAFLLKIGSQIRNSKLRDCKSRRAIGARFGFILSFINILGVDRNDLPL